MSRLYKSFALILALICLTVQLAGCHGSGKTEQTPVPTASADNTEDGSSAVTDAPEDTELPEETELPEWMWTPDPAIYALGEDGYYEDDYLTVYWPSYLEVQSALGSNAAQYVGYPEGSDKKLVFCYLPDEGGSFEDEIGVFKDAASYEEFMQSNGSPYYVKEFTHIKIDGHDTLRAVIYYDPADEPEHFVRMLQYAINVNGWILQISFSTQADTFPEECITCINTIHFKDGY